MPDYKKRLFDMLEKHGAILERKDGPHLVYRLPNKEMVSIAKTPSDHRVWANQMRHVRRALGLINSAPKTYTTPKEKRVWSKVNATAPKELSQRIAPVPLDLGQKLATALVKGGYVSPEVYHPPKPPRKVPKEHIRASPVKSVPPHIIRTGNILGVLVNEQSRDEYLKHYMDTGEEKTYTGEKKGFSMNLEGMLKQAKGQQEQLTKDIANNEATIKKLQAENGVKTELLKKSEEFIEQLQLTMLSYKDVEPLFIVKAVNKEEKVTKRKGGSTQRPSREGIPPVSQITRAAIELARSQPERTFTAEDFIAELKQKGEGWQNIDNRSMHSALSYELKKEDSLLERTGRGVFRAVPAIREVAVQVPTENVVAS